MRELSGGEGARERALENLGRALGRKGRTAVGGAPALAGAARRGVLAAGGDVLLLSLDCPGQWAGAAAMVKVRLRLCPSTTYTALVRSTIWKTTNAAASASRLRAKARLRKKPASARAPLHKFATIQYPFTSPGGAARGT